MGYARNLFVLLVEANLKIQIDYIHQTIFNEMNILLADRRGTFDETLFFSFVSQKRTKNVPLLNSWHRNDIITLRFKIEIRKNKGFPEDFQGFLRLFKPRFAIKTEVIVSQFNLIL